MHIAAVLDLEQSLLPSLVALKDAIKYAQGDFLYFVAPAFLLALIVVAFNLLGDGLRDALDPRSR